MKKLDDTDCKIANTFNEYFDYLNKSGMEKGVTRIEDESQLFILNVALSTVLTVLQGKEETITTDYFA